MRDRLIELLNKSATEMDCPSMEQVADYLLANGVIVPPCKVGDKVYIITSCENILMDYCFDGTGTVVCPFENSCDYEECDGNNLRLFETEVISLYNEGYGWNLECKHINKSFSQYDIGETVFLTKEEAEKALAERRVEQ